MKKTIVCIFAHPDDEAFGPGGTIAKLSQKNDVYVVCATKGEAGTNHHTDKETAIEKLREQELKTSAAILGVKAVYFLGFKDGTLCNGIYHEIAIEVEKIINKLKPETLLTYEMRGISGHIDHVVMSLVTSYIFERLDFVKSLYYFCLSTRQRAAHKTPYFIFRPPGYRKTEINKIIDTTDVWDIKVKAMMAHASQKKDANNILDRAKTLPKEENFIIIRK
jgi:N-acetylglucosamine malate deacetylase 2